MQFERGKALTDVQDEVEEIFKAEGDEKAVAVLRKAFDTVRKEVQSFLSTGLGLPVNSVSCHIYVVPEI